MALRPSAFLGGSGFGASGVCMDLEFRPEGSKIKESMFSSWGCCYAAWKITPMSKALMIKFRSSCDVRTLVELVDLVVLRPLLLHKQVKRPWIPVSLVCVGRSICALGSLDPLLVHATSFAKSIGLKVALLTLSRFQKRRLPSD